MEYTEIFGDVSATASGARRIKDVVAALAPPAKGAPALAKPAAPRPAPSSSLMAMVPGAIGAVGGAMMWKKHRVLGAVMGHAVGSNVLPIYKGVERTKALSQVAVEGAAVMGSLRYKKHPVLGFVGGALVGAIVTAFVPGSAANEYWHKWRNS